MRKQVALAASFLLALQIFASDRVQASQNQPVYNYGTWNNAQKLNVQWRPGGGYVQPAPYSPNRDIICYPASRTCTNNGRYSQSWTQSEFGWRGGQHYGGGNRQRDAYSPHRDIICYPASRTCTNNGRYSLSWTQSEFGWQRGRRYDGGNRYNGGTPYNGGNRQRGAYSPHRDIICYPDKRICTNNGRYSQSWTQSEFSWRGPR